MSVLSPTAPTPAVQVSFAVGVDMIKNGDLLSFFDTHEDSWLHRCTTVPILYGCGSKIFHSAIALWMTSGTGEKYLYCCEAIGIGRRLMKMEHFKDHKFEVTPRPDSVDERKVEEYMLSGIGTPYSFLDLPKIALKEFFGYDNVHTSTSGAVCSETAARAWEAGGLSFDTTTLSPGMLRNVLFQKHGIAPTILINPND